MVESHRTLRLMVLKALCYVLADGGVRVGSVYLLTHLPKDNTQLTDSQRHNVPLLIND